MARAGSRRQLPSGRVGYLPSLRNEATLFASKPAVPEIPTYVASYAEPGCSAWQAGKLAGGQASYREDAGTPSADAGTRACPSAVRCGRGN